MCAAECGTEHMHIHDVCVFECVWVCVNTLDVIREMAYYGFVGARVPFNGGAGQAC